MTDTRNTRSNLLYRGFDFLTLGLIFFLSCLLLSVEIGFGLLLQALAYATILVLFIRLAAWSAKGYKGSTNSIIWQILINAAGILVGTFVMILIGRLFASGSDLFVVIVFSGVVAFFILGTLSSIVCREGLLSHTSFE